MDSFLKQVIADVLANHHDLQNVTFVLPTKRSIVFLKRELSSCIARPIISPEIYAIEDFVEQLSGLEIIDNNQLLFEFYSAYLKQTKTQDQEPFSSFITWAPQILQDFNEIDRYLADPETVFGYLKAVKDLNHWSLKEPTEMIQNYLKFWNHLLAFYLQLNDNLLSKDLCYQGMAYRKALDNLEIYISNTAHKRHIFLGFNALNKAESLLIQELLQNDMAQIYWDSDMSFHNVAQHAAGLFTRNFQSNWPYYKRHEFTWIGKAYQEPKDIKITGIPKQVGQAKYVGQLLKSLVARQYDMSKVAVVLGEETLLLPMLNSIPPEIDHVNITMGLPLNYIPQAVLFEQLFKLHRTQSKHFYYKEVLAILTDATISSLIDNTAILNAIYKENKVYLSLDWLLSHSSSHKDVITLLFSNWNNKASLAIHNCHELIQELKQHYDKNPSIHRFSLEYLYKFYTIFNTLLDLNQQYGHLKTIEGLYNVYKELLNSETLDFKGEPLQGLQIMGMLESRALDFETVIITSVNEGILPGGKTANSVIPFEIKLEYGLPTYKEKDAIYTYHFYRLLQRAKHIHLIYNTEIDTLRGGEKSRFIDQLEVEGIHRVEHQVLSADVTFETPELKRIIKTPAIIDHLLKLGTSGFSPSALTKYVRNPLDYYYQYVLGIKDTEVVEEYIAANTLGTILHESLEELYQDFIGKTLTLKGLADCKSRIPEIVNQGFVAHYGRGNFDSGKNLIAFEVAKRYLYNFLEQEHQTVLKGHRIKILALEHKAAVPITVPDMEQSIQLKGTVDRIDEFDGQLRIIDYKTGKVTAGELAIYEWDALITEYSKSKAFQLLCYTYIYWKSTGVSLPIEAGIISFKNLKSGLLKFGEKPSVRGKVDPLITEATLMRFEELAGQLILEILDLNQVFEEKKI